jgi:hypothetical protein
MYCNLFAAAAGDAAGASDFFVRRRSRGRRASHDRFPSNRSLARSIALPSSSPPLLHSFSASQPGGRAGGRACGRAGARSSSS